MRDLKKKAMEGFARHGITAVQVGKKIIPTKPSQEMVSTTEAIAAIYRKYHLTARQTMQVQQILLDVAHGKKVIYVAPRPAGASTVFKASKEILALMNLPAKNLKASA